MSRQGSQLQSFQIETDWISMKSVFECASDPHLSLWHSNPPLESFLPMVPEHICRVLNVKAAWNLCLKIFVEFCKFNIECESCLEFVAKRQSYLANLSRVPGEREPDIILN